MNTHNRIVRPVFSVAGLMFWLVASFIQTPQPAMAEWPGPHGAVSPPAYSAPPYAAAPQPGYPPMPTTTSHVAAVSPGPSGWIHPNGSDYFGLQERKIMRWHDQTRTIMIYLSDGTHVKGWHPVYNERVKAAFYAWEQSTAGRFHFIFMPDARGSDVTVLWVARLPEGDDVSGLNECATWGKYIQRNDIKLATLQPDNTPQPPAGIQSVAQHEIGHMLGLKAHSDSPDDIMYPSLPLSGNLETRPISERDLRTLQKVYAAPADYTNPPDYHLSNFDQFRKTQKGRHLSLMWIPLPGVPFPIPIIIPF